MASSEKHILDSPVSVPVPHVPLGIFYFEQLKRHGDRIYQVHARTEESTTFTEILHKSISVAKWLKARGLSSGDILAISSENCLEYCLPVLGAAYLGITVATLNPTYTPRELKHAFDVCTPKIVFCSSSSEKTVTQVMRQFPAVQEVVVLSNSSSHGHVPLGVLLQQGPHNFTPVNVDPDENVAAILYSSGTTGLSKGVMLTDTNILTCAFLFNDPKFGRFYPEQVLLMVSPLFHSYMYLVQFAALALGFKTIVMPHFDKELFLQSIENHKVTLLLLVPTLMVFLAKHPISREYDLSSVNEIWCGSAPLSKDVQEQVMKKLNVPCIRQGYGLTEATTIVSVAPRENNKFGSTGKLAPGMMAKVVDLKTGETVGPNKLGELYFKGPVIMKGYYGNPKATQETVDSEGYLHSGDVGYYDDDEYFYVVDRVKELIKYKANQVPPAELEAILLTHPAVQDAAVIGIPDEIAGELPMAYVVKQPGATVTEREITRYVADQVSQHKRLRGGVKFIAAIPKTTSGKIIRRELRNMAKSKL